MMKNEPFGINEFIPFAPAPRALVALAFVGEGRSLLIAEQNPSPKAKPSGFRPKHYSLFIFHCSFWGGAGGRGGGGGGGAGRGARP
ncbi:MAG: hypothetical protein LBT01_04395, partial [Spirochaetaceae bacterium]|nr:hypothetical protein [Spirochaetaceae bacterium]